MKEIAIRENHLYQKVFRRGKRAGGRLVSVCVLRDLSANRLRRANPRKQAVNRIGLSVPKRESGAIGRNRVKRIIREGLRQVTRERPLRTGFLIVIAARPGIEKRKSTEIAAELRYLFRKLDMFRPSRMHLRTARTAVSHETRLYGADPFLSARAVCTQALPYLPLYPYLLRIRLRGV